MDDTTRATIATDGGLKKEIHDARILLTSVRRTLAALLDDLNDTTGGDLREIAAKHSELERALARVFDVEQKHHEWERRHAGTLGAGDIDFDALRHQIGCRLHRLRECCQTE